MNICMVVCNNLTRDNRVLREAQTLQAAGHQVSVVGIATEDADRPCEVTDGGVQLFRVDWRSAAVRRLRIRAVPWILLAALLLGIAFWIGTAFSVPMAHALSSLAQKASDEIATKYEAFETDTFVRACQQDFRTLPSLPVDLKQRINALVTKYQMADIADIVRSQQNELDSRQLKSPFP